MKTKIYEGKINWILREEIEVKEISNSESVVEYMQGAFDERPEQEQIWLIPLNRKNLPKGRILLTIGTQTGCLVSSKEIFRTAILSGATAFVLVHNHPSGDPAPSAADLNITRKIRDAAVIVDIEFLDHIIIGSKENDPTGRGYYSFKDVGII